MVTREDVSNLEYFLDIGIDRWSSWDENKSRLLAEIPELDDWIRAQRVADNLRRSLIVQLSCTEVDQ